jgi:BCD family chlorophyll transporter-like MFS transporter
MSQYSRKLLQVWTNAGTRFLPFADVATPELPLGRLLRLSLFQVSVGMALVLMIGTLNRVMIVELAVPAWLVGIMVSVPILFAPFRALVGFRSDTHTSQLGWKRVPFIWKGTLLQFSGLAVMPFALLVLSGGGNAAQHSVWVGRVGAAFAFALVGAGLHMTQTVGLALATDLAPPHAQPKVVGLMYVMLLVGMVVCALVFGFALLHFDPAKLVSVVQAAAVATMVLNVTALWKQEPRRARGQRSTEPDPTFRESWSTFASGEGATRRLVAVGVGTMAFSMEDILLEPYGGQILGLSVGATTKLTATLAVGGLLGFAVASRVLSRGADPFRMASLGAVCGIPAFILVIAAAPLGSALVFALGTAGIGFGAGLFGHGTLTATMNSAPASQRGLALGAWGAVQATAGGVAVGSSGVIRDVVAASLRAGVGDRSAALGYTTVYAIEIVLLVVALVAMAPLVRRGPSSAAGFLSRDLDTRTT